MKHILTVFCLTIVWLVVPDHAASASPDIESIEQAVLRNLGHRPRLLLDQDTFARINQAAQQDPMMDRLRRDVLIDADAILKQSLLERKMRGRRLLRVSREALRRIATLAMAYRLTDDKRFLIRAEQEMLAVCDFSDWNPSHYLDVAEMTMGTAIGYDWLHSELDEESKRKIRRAIVEKGIKPSFSGKQWWVNSTNNWNQVCHGGLTAGAIAVMEHHPELAAKVVHRALQNVPLAMKESFDPSGTYPEGPAYWAYGTTYNVLLIECLRTSLGTDFGLGQERGFDVTVNYFNHAIAPNGQVFNYCDASPVHGGFEPVVYWLAAKFGQPFWTTRMDQLYVDGCNRSGENRFLPLILLWRTDKLVASSETPPLSWLGLGGKPVAMHRSRWNDPRAIYLGVCAGSPSSSHGHMDIGAFVFDAGGVRWALDLRSQDYHSLESRNVELWNKNQDGQRWSVFRLNNLGHNTLVINGQLQRVVGKANFVGGSNDLVNPFNVIDMTDVYRGQAGSVVRGFALPERRQLIIYDRIERLTIDSTIRWGFVTEAKVVVESPTHAVLEQDGQRLHVELVLPSGSKFTVFDTALPKQAFDAPNPGTRMLGFEVKGKAGQSLDLVVMLTPSRASNRDHGRHFLSMPPTKWQTKR